jgi:molybdopterin converting factor small subunit
MQTNQELTSTQVMSADVFTISKEKEGKTLFEIVKEAVPELEDSSIRNFFSYSVNGEIIEDCDFVVSEDDEVQVIPEFAGGR